MRQQVGVEFFRIPFFNASIGGGGTTFGRPEAGYCPDQGFLWDPLILVLDEATSGLDSYTETTLKKALGLVLKNRTDIVIAHRFVLLGLVGRIYVLQEGSIKTSGRQEQVYRQSRLFKDFYDNQVFLENAVRR